MRPFFSVTFFTVSSGAGYGLLALLGLVGNAHGKASTMAFGLTAITVAMALIPAGLVASTAHLGGPQQALQSLWVSRSRIAAVITYPIALAYGCAWSGLVDAPVLIAPLGILSALICAVTAFCLGMIYHSRKASPAWHSKVEVLSYLAFALASGSGLLNAISFVFGRFQTDAGKFMALLTAVLILIAITLKWFDRSNHNRKLQIIMFALLAMALLLTLLSLILPWLTFIVALLILMAAWAERWHFFA
jgi:DMSO reductase anchor subunit